MSTWTPPNEGEIKINVDIAIGKGKAWLATIARDEGGQVIESLITQEEHDDDPLVAESLAVRRVASWAL